MSKTSKLTVKRIIKSDPETIFEALTDQVIMQKWFFAGPDGWSATVKSKAKAGEEYRIDMHGETDTYTHTGMFKEVVPNKNTFDNPHNAWPKANKCVTARRSNRAAGFR